MEDKENLLPFLLNADFKKDYGYSYTELLRFLKAYQFYYKKIYQNNDWFKQELMQRDKVLAELNTKISKLEERLNSQDKHISVLTSYVNKKLSFWERITGKIKI